MLQPQFPDLLTLRWSGGPLRGTALLPASKSESNRALIIQALAGAGTLHNLSEANDTQLMRRLLAHPEAAEFDAEDAGTVMRFLTAFLAATGRCTRLTGTARMQERPIGVLVEALEQLGARIEYANCTGYPPLRLLGWQPRPGGVPLSVRGDISSQFISALMMIGPLVPGGLHLQLTGAVGSRPYILMTAALMRHFGAAVEVQERDVHVAPQPYQPADYTVEADWSAASYWYSLVALAPEGSELRLPGLRRHSWQGDQAIARLMEPLGVRTEFEADGVVLRQLPERAARVAMNFTDCPDLAQTIAVVAAATGVVVDMTGLESLRIKETDRITALQRELAKFGAALAPEGRDMFRVSAPNFHVGGQTVATYHDHRMAMAFAPLALRGDVTVEAPAVVRKSYPFFWEELRQAGFRL